MSREDYIEVKERLQTFYDQYPEGSLQSEYELTAVNGDPHVIVKAYAYRTPDDPRPGVGHAWEPIPGRTPFTRGSELMNGETSAWGRALAALGIAVHRGIATGDEVRAAQNRGTEKLKATPENDPYYISPPGDEYQATVPPAHLSAPATEKQIGAIFAIMKPWGVTADEQKKLLNDLLKVDGRKVINSTKELTKDDASYLIGKLKASVSVQEATAMGVDP